METIRVEAQRDHIQNLCHTKPLTAIAELIWNSLDADAGQVTVDYDFNTMAGIREIRVVDDGHGIPLEDAKRAFKNLGGSWKRDRDRTRGERRFLHGKEGKGRFRAFALGTKVIWRTRFRSNGKVLGYDISGSFVDPSKFEIGDTAEGANLSPGTSVVIEEPTNGLGSLLTDDARQHLAERFAIYLRQYPRVHITYNGTPIDPASVEVHSEDYKFFHRLDGRDDPIPVRLTIIEWTGKTGRSLLLCDGEGFTLHETKPGIQARGYNFTAYLCAEYLRELHDQGILDVEELSPALQSLLDAAKSKMRLHFRRREAEQARTLIDEWKLQEIYPYEGEPLDPVEAVERQVFDVLAVNINEYHPDFGSTENTNKKLTLRLLRHAVETRPATIGKILEGVVALPIAKQEEFAELIQKTSLDAIITASKVVTDRLDFLQGFNTFLFDKESRKEVLERRQLQQILVREPWVFGEMYNLAQQEAMLTDVLRRHYELLGHSEEIEEEVERLDGTQGRVDLMFGAVIPYPDQGKRVHLIVELKRPSRSVDGKAIDQVQSYAEAVASDSRFNMTDTQWEFYAISNDMDDRIRTRANEKGKPPGLYLDHPEKPIRIWAKTWGQVIQDCEARLRFFKERLEYSPSHQSGIAYLQKVHANYLPPSLAAPEEFSQSSFD